MTDEFIEQGTQHIQQASVAAFASALGYYESAQHQFVESKEYGLSKGVFKGCATIDYNTMVTLHNAKDRPSYMLQTYWDGLNNGKKVVIMAGKAQHNKLPFQLDAYTLRRAQACRIVEQVFLQKRKNGAILCHKNLVKFIDQEYQYLFLGV